MYLPPSVILPEVFYTNGGEYYYSNQIIYVGYYHKDKYGNVYTGKIHDNTSQKLIPAFNLSSPLPSEIGISTLANTYNNLDLSPQSSFGLQPPINDSLPPTNEDYIQTYYTRYIIEYKLSSKLFIVETSKSTYFTYFNSSFNSYFNFAEVLWKISGPLYDVKENGVLIQGGVIDSNLRSINTASNKISQISSYLNDLTLYYKS